MGKRPDWWNDPEVMANAPDSIREAARQAAEDGNTFDDTDTDAGTSGDVTDTRN